MFEQKPKPKQQPGQDKPTSQATPGLTTPKSAPLRWLNRSGAQTPTRPATSAAKKPSSTPTPQHAVYRPPTAPTSGTPAPKPPTSDPMRARIGAFGDKETRQALYSVYAVIKAAEAVNPKQAQEALRVFEQQTLKDKDLTAQEARKLAQALNLGFSAQVGSQGAVLDGGNPDLTNKAYQDRVLAGYNALTGSKKNTTVPGVGAFFEVKTPPLTKEQQAIFGAMAGAGPGIGALGSQVVAGVMGRALKSPLPKPETPASGDSAPPNSLSKSPANTTNQTSTQKTSGAIASAIAYGRPLKSNSVVVDSNVVIALDKFKKGLPLQPGEQASLNKINSLGKTDVRVAERTRSESTYPLERTPIINPRSSPAYQALLGELDANAVGRGKGSADREIVADVFFAKTEIGVTPTFATHDKGIYNPLLRMSGIKPEKLGKPVPEAYPNGFEVTVNGRTIRVVPLPRK